MHLLKNLLFLLSLWRPAFCKEDTYYRAREHAIASICSIGRHTISNLIIWLGRDQKDHTADYRLYNEYGWAPNELFNPLLEQCLNFFPNDYVVVGTDDTRIKKTGKKIPGVAWGRDPVSPPFQVNLLWGQRFLQFSALVPMYQYSSASARGIPIRFVHAPPIKKPRKTAKEEEHLAYKEKVKTHNLSSIYVHEVEGLRRTMNKIAPQKKLLMVGDGSFCNKICMGMNITNVEMIARTRKNARLCFEDKTSSRRTYSVDKFTPEAIRKDETVLWKKSSFYYGEQWREIRYKEVKDVLWQSGTKTKKLRLIVIAPLPYVKGGVRNYRNPGYLLCTDLKADLCFLIQSYLDRWQIEVNFREEKSLLGVGEAQVRSKAAIDRQPAFRVAAYSALLLASIMTSKDEVVSKDTKEPLWRKKPPRVTCRALIGNMRKVLISNPDQLLKLGLPPPVISDVFSKAT